MFMKFVLGQIKKRGYEVSKPGYSDKTAITYRKLIQHFNIDLIIDVGANEGQFAQGMRRLGFTGKISSFEPLSDVFKVLSRKAEKDNLWQVFNLALGNADGQQEINVSKNRVSSSLLEMEPEHVKQEPESLVISKQKITVKRLDTIWDQISPGSGNVFLKLDVQGFEKFVLEGAKSSLKHIKLIQLEMALVPLYKEELLLAEMLRYMEALGFSLYNLLGGFNNFETGQQFQVDGIFIRTEDMH
jgi:FkbM family methyltransferase